MPQFAPDASSEEATGYSSEESVSLLSDGSPVGRLTTLKEPILLDDDDALIVIVFPRQLAKEAVIHNPEQKAALIFGMGDGDASCCRPCIAGKSLPATEYHSFVRDEVVRRLGLAGFSLSSFVSIDRDEVFLKIGLDSDGQNIRVLAQKFQYQMPIRREAYAGFDPNNPGRKDEFGCPLDDYGRPVPAYQPYVWDNDAVYARFSDVDAVRIAMLRIRELVHLTALQAQGVATCWFVAAKYRRIVKLGHRLTGWRSLVSLPNPGDEDLFRGYFGEQIAFFFQWVASYTRMLLPIAVLVGVCRGVEWIADMPMVERDVIRLSYTLVIAVWAQWFNTHFQRSCARSSQRWGMKDYDTTTAIPLSSHRPELDRSRTLFFRKVGVTLAWISFCLAFAVLIVLSDEVISAERRAMVTVTLIKVGSFLWSQIAGKLVGLQNHRTQGSWNDSLTTLLSGVKIFCAGFPFLYLAFIVRLDVTCGETLEMAAQEVYCSEKMTNDSEGCSWPIGVDPMSPNVTAFLDQGSFSWPRGDQEVCISGCFPTRCALIGGRFTCTTNCWDQLKYNFKTLYISHIALTVVFLLVPRLQTSIAWHWEQHQAKKMFKDKGGSGHSTFLQWQAKHHKFAAYSYLSWGGSPAEDFLELAISFALLTCFSTLYPVLAVGAFMCHLVEYRLLARRMIFITSRPMPWGAEGIGQWSAVMSFVSNIAVLINAGLVLMFYDPVRHWPADKKLMAFVVLEHILILLKMLAFHFIPGVPEDVKCIEVYNTRFSVWLRARSKTKVPETEQRLPAEVDVGLSVLGSDSE